MRDLQRRLDRLKYRRLYQLAARVGQPSSLSADTILAEARRVLALPEAVQRQLFKDFYETLSEAEVADLDAIKRRHAAVLRRAR